MSKFIKQLEMDDLRRTFKSVRDVVLLTAEKLDAQGEYTLRKKLREKKVSLRQVKNSLTRKVFKEMAFQVPDDSPFWAKSTVVAWGAGSIKELSQAIDAELKVKANTATAPAYREKVRVKGAIADGQPITFEQGIVMPTRLELIGQIIGMALGPASQIAGCLIGPVGQVASQVEQISKKEEAAPAA